MFNSKSISWTILLPVLIVILGLSSFAFAQEKVKVSEKPTAKVILDMFDDLWRGDSSETDITMNIKTAHWERSLTMKAFSLGKDFSLVRVKKPLKERGTSTLKVKNELYNYLPKTDRTIKLTSAMMGGSWMGSHFTNDDLVKESRMAEDYDSKISFTGEREGKKIIEITSTPKPDAAVVWGKVVSIVRENDWQPLSVIYYDEDGEKVREMVLSEHKKIGDRTLPLKMKMVPTDKPKEFTEVIYKDLKFGVKLDKGFFSINQLRR